MDGDSICQIALIYSAGIKRKKRKRRCDSIWGRRAARGTPEHTEQNMNAVVMNPWAVCPVIPAHLFLHTYTVCCYYKNQLN